jgi:acyl dehydratase
MGITGENNYYEDFVVGDKYIHPRGRTVTEMDNVMVTHMTMNTASPHFDEELMKKWVVGKFGGKRVVMGGFTISLILGLTTEDLSENALAEVFLDKIRLPTPVYHGDTLYAESEVLGKEDSKDNPNAGIVYFKTIGKNQEGNIVFEGERKVLIKKRSSYLKKT